MSQSYLCKQCRITEFTDVLDQDIPDAIRALLPDTVDLLFVKRCLNESRVRTLGENVEEGAQVVQMGCVCQINLGYIIKGLGYGLQRSDIKEKEGSVLGKRKLEVGSSSGGPSSSRPKFDLNVPAEGEDAEGDKEVNDEPDDDGDQEDGVIFEQGEGGNAVGQDNDVDDLQLGLPAGNANAGGGGGLIDFFRGRGGLAAPVPAVVDNENDAPPRSASDSGPSA